MKKSPWLKLKANDDGNLAYEYHGSDDGHHGSDDWYICQDGLDKWCNNFATDINVDEVSAIRLYWTPNEDGGYEFGGPYADLLEAPDGKNFYVDECTFHMLCGGKAQGDLEIEFRFRS